MYTSFQPKQYNVMPILNSNRITDETKKEAIKAMGLSACQVGCMMVSGSTNHSRKH